MEIKTTNDMKMPWGMGAALVQLLRAQPGPTEAMKDLMALPDLPASTCGISVELSLYDPLEGDKIP